MKYFSASRPALALALISAPTSAWADAKIGLQFVSARQAAQLDVAESAGTALTAQTNWNWSDTGMTGTNANVAGPAAGTLVNDAGVATSVQVAWNASGTWNTGNGITTPESKVLNGYIDHTSGGSATVDFTGIPYARYSVVVYFGSDGNGRTGKINSSTAGVAYSYTTNSNFARGVTQADYKLTTDTANGNPSANYCIFANQTSPNFSLNIIRGSNNSGFHAVQIIEGGDTDGDGMPDSWEITYGLSPLVNDAAGDPDGDGSPNLEEYNRGTNPNVADTDGDGLTDGAETLTGVYVSPANTGTDPLKTDTDADGLPDANEVNVRLTNPVKRDTDGDGYTDGYEVTKGTNPLVASSNPSVIADKLMGINFTGGSGATPSPVSGAAGAPTYVQSNWNNKNGASGNYGTLIDADGAAVDAIVTWAAAGTYAVVDPGANPPADANSALMAGYLDTTSTSTTTVTVENIPYRFYDVVVYADGDSGDGSRAGTYSVNSLVRNEVRDGSNWPVATGSGLYAEAETDGSTGNYIVFRGLTGGTARIVAKPTTAALFRAPLNAVQIIGTGDSDGDGMPDQWELDNGFNPASAADASQDADSDGLTNLQEFQRSTKPRVADSDGDGLNDGVETGTGTYVSPTDTGTDPLLADTDGDGLSDAVEVTTHGTSPVKRDTDGDGFGDGYEIIYATDPKDAAKPTTDAVRAIGLNFNATGEFGLAPTDAAGFLVTRQTRWNNADGALTGTNANITGPTAGALVDNTGASTPATVSWTSAGVWTYANGTGADGKLMGGYLDNTGGGATVSFADIPYKKYDAIVYFGSDGNGRTGSIASATTGTEFFYTTASNPGTGFLKDGYVETTVTAAGTNPSANFCRFKGLNSPTLDLQVNRGSNNSGFFAVQLVEVAPQGVAVTSVSRAANGHVFLTWKSDPGASYYIEQSLDLVNWALVDTDFPSAGTSTTFEDGSLPAGTLKMFYRILKN